MKKWDTVAIVGVGLIGGSIGLALRQRGLARQVIGVGRRASSLRKARQSGAVTSTTTRLSRGVASAELIVVCTPVDDVVERVCAVAENCPSSALITDAGSTKTTIVRQLSGRLGNGATFVGSHPLAGSEKTGPENARPDLFDDRLTVVTPADDSPSVSVDQVERFWSLLGSRVVRLHPEVHDRVVAMTSHATHVIAAALAAATSDDELPLASSGWRDTTRVAGGDPQLWLPILMTNRNQVLKSLNKFEKVLSNLRAALERGDKSRILKLLNAGKQTRDSVGS